MLWLSVEEEPIDIPPFDFSGFFAAHWWEYILIFIFLVFIYNKVFRTRKLPLLKDLIVYLIIAVGAFVLLIFQVDAGLPILLSLSIAVAMMLIVRIRYFFAERNKKHESATNSKDSEQQ